MTAPNFLFTRAEFDALRAIVFRLNANGSPAYPGYRPQIVESPNGDGVQDREKRYAHIARKYMQRCDRETVPLESDRGRLWNALRRCHAEALRVHAALGLPAAWAPDIDASALRILEYPPGATSARHTDFDLFTLVAYRDPYPGGLLRGADIAGEPDDNGDLAWADDINPGIHFGELYELGGFGAATPHEVRAVTQRQTIREDVQPFVECVTSEWVAAPQFSAVYFALPRHDLVLPDGRKVGPQTQEGTYLHERMSRSRVYSDRTTGEDLRGRGAR